MVVVKFTYFSKIIERLITRDIRLLNEGLKERTRSTLVTTLSFHLKAVKVKPHKDISIIKRRYYRWTRRQ